MSNAEFKKVWDMNPNKNREIVDRFLQQNIVVCVSGLVTMALNNNEISNAFEFFIEDVENLSLTIEQALEKELIEAIDAQNMTDLGEEYCEREVFEWWVISDYLHKKLTEKLEPTVNDFGPDCWKIWGRCTTGQNISMDNVMREICFEMEILCGQKYTWEAIG